MNTSRTAIVELAVPGHVSDQELANRLWQVLRQACQPAAGEGLRLFYPDPASLEVRVFGAAASELLPGYPANGS
ncbi:hypothetical protein [Bosea sp. (in: a-proteobacteria)]|uniref:hypothetical protein n=1 Tax=Bosea sp. (in: a-proteobacteria) TaxID=1871050 RepID=UPI0025C6672F|nr:hypothetical protein [Bosea sp. (in: a-proteobacteria)]MBR3190853.1 hypothetical protein [Bosea sp. (in: a-proteobacteria)]